MFPIRWNFPFRKKNGALSTIGAEIENAGGYTLPTASSETKGGIKIGSGLAMEGEVLNNSNPTPYSLPTAAADTKGGIKVGAGLSIDENGVLSASGSSGGSLSYVDFDNVSLVVSGNAMGIANIQATATSGLVGKRIVSGNCRSGNAISVIDAIAPHDPIEENDWIVVTAINRTTEAQSASKIRIWYV